jgi:hypothetical protein
MRHSASDLPAIHGCALKAYFPYSESSFFPNRIPFLNENILKTKGPSTLLSLPHMHSGDGEHGLSRICECEGTITKLKRIIEDLFSLTSNLESCHG